MKGRFEERKELLLYLFFFFLFSSFILAISLGLADIFCAESNPQAHSLCHQFRTSLSARRCSPSPFRDAE